MKKEGMLYKSLPNQDVLCSLCSHRCQIAPSKFGVCRVRQNKDGKLSTHVYGEVIAAHVDPIEKKPLYHFLPGSLSFSIATEGCNFQCPYCQNWQISQMPRKKGHRFSGESFTPEEIVSAALRHKCQSISYTYTEPTVFFEYAFDTAKLAKKSNLSNVFVTNGFMTAEALEIMNPFLDACNVDLKSFSEKFYKEICRAQLQPVLESIRLMKKLNIWVEITTLIIPGLNDGEEELNQLTRFIANVNPEIPWHISRFHPDYEYHEAHATPIETLRRALSLGKSNGLQYIYIGNVIGEAEDTHCPRCQKLLIRRQGYGITDPQIKGSVCTFCGHPISGVFKTGNSLSTK